MKEIEFFLMKDNRGNATDGLERGNGTRKKGGRSRILTSKPQAINPFVFCQHQQLPGYTTMTYKGKRRRENKIGYKFCCQTCDGNFLSYH